MRTAITKSILVLGRYAVLPIAALAVALFFGWLVAFDTFPRTAAICLPVIIAIATVAISLAIGFLLPAPRTKARNAVDEGAAPGLWAMWNELDGATPRARRTLEIDPALNASIGEDRRCFGLLHRDITMTVGLPLLLVLDEGAVRAVVAHEVAHARLQHTTGGANLYEFMVAAANLFDHLDPEHTISGRIAHLLLSSLLKWVEAEFWVIRRQNELEADREAADRVGVHDMARALVLVDGAAAGMKELIMGPLDKELLGAIRAPTPPLQRLVDQLDAIRAHRPTDAAAETKQDGDTEDYHPPLRERLANLGFAAIPQVEAPRMTAAEALLSTAAMKELFAKFNDKWRRNANEAIGIH